MNHRQRAAQIILWIVMLVVIVSLRTGHFWQSAAAQNATDLPGVDVLLLIDQSGSMGGQAAGSKAHPEANDKLGLRFEGPQDLVALIAEDRLQAPTPTLHRVALVAFGDRATVRLPWTDLVPGSWEELQAQKASLNAPEGGLAEGPFTNTNLGNTNFQLAFDQAAKMFDQLPGGETGRMRTIIVVTDGQPCIPPPDTPTPGPATPTATPGGYSSPCLSAARHMQDLQASVSRMFPANQYRIFVVALNDSRDSYWPNMEKYWLAITGSPERAQKVTSNDDLAILLRKYWREMNPTVGIVEPIRPGPVVVPPYLDTITFTLFKSRPEENLEVRDGANVLLTKDAPNVDISGENILKVTVLRPLPGLWRVSTTGSQDNIDIEMRAVVAKGNLNSPSGSQVQFVPASIEWQLLDSRGQPLPEYTDARYRLEPSVQIKADGEVTPVTLQYKGNSTYEAIFTPVKAALHTITMEAVAHDLNNTPITVYSGEVATFAVGQVNLQPVNLAPSYSQFVPITLTYELRDPAGQPVGVKSSVTVTATVQSVTGGASWPVPMLAIADGRFQGEYVPLEAGPQNIKVAASITEPNGSVRPLAEGAGGSFTVTPLMVTPKSPAGTQAQHIPMTIAYQVLDGQGNELKLGPGYQMVFTGTISIGSQQAPMLTLEPTDATTYATTHTPDQQGNYSLVALASVKAPDGRVYPAYTHRTQVAVIPTTQLLVQFAHPGPREQTQYVRRLGINPLKFFSVPNKLVVEIQLVDETGNVIDPRTVLAAGATMPVELKVVDADGKKDYSGKFLLSATGVPGVFRAEGDELPPGRYSITGAVVSTVRTQPAYVIPEANRTAQVVVQLRENPFWVALWIAIITALAGLIAYIIFHRWQLQQLSKHPATGTIVVENEYRSILASKTIAGRNYLVLKEFPPATQIRKLEIRCTNELDSKQGVVQFSAQLIDGSRAAGRLSPGGPRTPLGKYKVYLRKG